MDSFKTLIYSKVGGIARISLNRPAVLNAYNMEMRDELYQVLGAVRDDPEVGVAVLAGEGRAFCAGADLTEFGSAPSLAMARDVRWERDIWGAFLGIYKPMIAAINGYCLGSGLEMSMLCDLRIAGEDSVFGMPEVALGMIPAAGGTQTLPRVLGISPSLDLLLTGRRIGAAEALAMGLVGRIVSREALQLEAEAAARQLLDLDPEVLGATKRAVWQGSEMALDKALDLEARLELGVVRGGWETQVPGGV